VSTRFSRQLESPYFRRSAAAAITGGVLLAVGAFVAPGNVATSYLVAYTATVAIVVGALMLIMMAHLSGAVWYVVLRRSVERALGGLPALALLALPLLVAPHAFWPWAVPFDRLPLPLQQAMEPKRTYFHPAFFAARTIVYWMVWIGAGERLRRAFAQLGAGAGSAADSLRVVSVIGLALAGLALTFASFDWMMSLSPDWSSSVYAVYYFAGAMVSALAVTNILASRQCSRGDERSPTTDHFQALGRLTLAFLLFWAYLWYVQFFVIWIADVPGEATWYAVRLSGAWHVFTRVLVTTAFVLPFLVLLFRAARGSSAVLGGLSVWLLTAHYLDVYWLVVPTARPHWSLADLVWDLGAIGFIGGTTVAVAVWRSGEEEIRPIADPMLQWSVRYQAH
jgi:hypothetical protein